MDKVWAIARRDLVAAFTAPLAWLVLAAWTFVTGITLGITVLMLQGATADSPLYVSSLSAGFVLLMFLAPALTMTAFAAERQYGTMALLVTAPVGDAQLVAGKALASFLLLASLALALLPQVAGLALMSSVAPMQFTAGMIGLLLAAAAATGIGIWISLLVDSPVTAYVLTFGAILVLTLVGLLPQDTPFGRLAEAIGLGPRIAPFLAGRIEAGSVAYFLAVAAGGLVLARSVVAARRIDG
jgi:ABC-2 type transport system permease protein